MMSSRFPGRFEIHREYSINAAKNFKDSSLDFVYIDGRHDYTGVKEDVEAWYPKLKEGGLFAGHDFVLDEILQTGDFGVQKGVSEFARLMGKEVQSISTKGVDGGRVEPQSVDGGWNTWYFLK
jgi:predicted O-methyltransferase YrrM